jgi:serpin B
MPQIVEGANQFACALYTQIAGSTSGNIFFSPSSIWTALAMTYAGAAGRTAEEMATTLGLNLPDDELHLAIKLLHDRIRPAGVELRIANRLWGQEGYRFLTDFTATIERFYGAPICQVDFRNKAEEARQEINQWVEQQTNNRIKDLVPAGAVDPLTRLVLVSAIYFLGRWESVFNEDATHDAPFWLRLHDQHPVRMMRHRNYFAYGEFDDLMVLELPYQSRSWQVLDEETSETTDSPEASGDLVMTVLLPRRIDGLVQVEARLGPSTLAQWSSLNETYVDVRLPKFTIDHAFGLSEVLLRMGLRRAFSVDEADFSRMSDNPEFLFLAAALHRAFIKVDEEGTEAAGVTGVMLCAGFPKEPEPKIFEADHPFLFVIRDRDTGLILFCGRLVEPSEEA